ncbi:radical SAM protein [Desulfovibrio sp.]|uniref:radical SAM protein n=1 Tax=Desulfovibrio sp. TaxID=885 RepID=UPI003AB72C42
MAKSLYTYIAKKFCESIPPTLLPLSMEFDLTNICNQNCVYCNAASYRQSQRDMTVKDDYKKIFDSCIINYANSNQTLPTITFVGGGEPTLHKDFSEIISYALEKNFLTSVITNGIHIDKICDIPANLYTNIAWIGIDIDAGTKNLYNKIRRPKNKGDFDRVCINIEKLTSSGLNVDLKVLLIDTNSNKEAITDILLLAKELKVRMVYFRLAVVKDGIHKINTELVNFIKSTSQNLGINIRINLSRTILKNYNKCYSFFLLPVFAADGYTYLCCENRGNKKFALCNWTTEDFFERWCSSRHLEIWDKTNTKYCAPCRANIHNFNIQNVLNDKKILEELFF